MPAVLAHQQEGIQGCCSVLALPSWPPWLVPMTASSDWKTSLTFLSIIPFLILNRQEGAGTVHGKGKIATFLLQSSPWREVLRWRDNNILIKVI